MFLVMMRSSVYAKMTKKLNQKVVSTQTLRRLSKKKKKIQALTWKWKEREEGEKKDNVASTK